MSDPFSVQFQELQDLLYSGYSNPCGEVELGEVEECALPFPEPAKCVCDIKDLMSVGHDKGCPEAKASKRP